MHFDIITQNWYHVELIYSCKKWRFVESIRQMTRADEKVG